MLRAKSSVQNSGILVTIASNIDYLMFSKYTGFNLDA